MGCTKLRPGTATRWFSRSGLIVYVSSPAATASTINAEDFYLPYGWPEPPILTHGEEMLVLLTAPPAGQPSSGDERPKPTPLAAVHLRPAP